MKKLLTALLITGVFSATSADATDRHHHKHHHKHRKHRHTEVVDDCPIYPKRPVYFGFDIGYAETKVRPPRAFLKSVALNARIGYMDNIDYFLYGLEGGLGWAQGRVTRAGIKVRTYFNVDLVLKLGIKIDRAATYALVGPSIGTFRVVNIATSDSTAKYKYGTVLGFGVMYDLTRRFAVKFEHRHVKYSPISAQSVSRIKPSTNFTLIGFLYRL